jgi:endonuclease/exonuclease/phosphatase family metal-dependent hydrolase
MRICTWNIQLGLRLDAVLNAVRTREDFREIDLFAIQEASVHGGRQDASAIAEVLGDDYAYIQATAQIRRGREQGNALVWHRGAFRPSPAQIVSLSGPTAVKIAPAERALLRAIRPQQRMAVRAESRALRVYVMHLDVMGFTHKLVQLETVLTDMSARPPVPLTVVAGDLNTFGPARLRMWRRIDAAAHTAGLIEATKGVRRTHWTSQKLDAIYVRADRAFTHRAWALDLRASDHWPLFAEIDLADRRS